MSASEAVLRGSRVVTATPSEDRSSREELTLYPGVFASLRTALFAWRESKGTTSVELRALGRQTGSVC